MNGTGYDSATKPSPAFFTKDQRQRVEALTVAHALKSSASAQDLIDMAGFIYNTSFVFRDRVEAL